MQSTKRFSLFTTNVNPVNSATHITHFISPIESPTDNFNPIFSLASQQWFFYQANINPNATYQFDCCSIKIFSSLQFSSRINRAKTFWYTDKFTTLIDKLLQCSKFFGFPSHLEQCTTMGRNHHLVCPEYRSWRTSFIPFSIETPIMKRSTCRIYLISFHQDSICLLCHI